MKGTNYLTLNQATMQEAVEEWVKARWLSRNGDPVPGIGPIVFDSSTNTFKITLQDRAMQAAMQAGAAPSPSVPQQRVQQKSSP